MSKIASSINIVVGFAFFGLLTIALISAVIALLGGLTGFDSIKEIGGKMSGLSATAILGALFFGGGLLRFLLLFSRAAESKHQDKVEIPNSDTQK